MDFLTLEDLYEAVKNRKRSFKFDASQNGKPLVVHSFGKLNFEENNEEAGLTKVRFENAANTGENLNKSYIDVEVMKNKLMPTFKNRPILGYIHEVDGEPQFYTHNMHLEDDEIVYDEITVGIIPESNNAELTYNAEDDNYILQMDGYIFDNYTKAAEILERDKECTVSVEIAVTDMSFNAKDKVLNINDGFFSGITLLGVDPEGNKIAPGMKGAHAKLADFEKDVTYSLAPDSELSVAIDKLKEAISVFDSLKNGEEVKEDMEMNENVEITEEEIVEETVEETVEESAEETIEESEESADTENFDGDSDGSDATGGDNTDGDNTDEGSADGEDDGEDSEEEYDGSLDSFQPRTLTNGAMTYELSHDDIRWSLYNLLDAYADEDNEWYHIDAVFDNHFIYSNWFGDKIFGQNYTKNGDVVAFDGDRYKMYLEYLNQEQYDALQNMRQTYSSIQTELNEYKEKELNTLRNEVISDASYAQFLNEPEFKDITSNIDNYSVDELRNACDIAFAKCVKRVGNYSKSEPDKPEHKDVALFAFGNTEHKSDFLEGLLKLKRK